MKPVDILTLESGQCKWPVTDKPPHLFCACPQAEESPYCPEHTKRAISPKSAATLRGRPFL